MATYTNLSENELREIFREIVKKAGGQRAFSRKAGVNVSEINKFLNGQPPTPKVLKKMGAGENQEPTTYYIVTDET